MIRKSNAPRSRHPSFGFGWGDEKTIREDWCARQELNLRPAGSKPDALSN